MTTKPKRKVPAKPKQAPGEPNREARKIEELVTRWKWLEADQDYQTAIAASECDADRRHDAEQERIIAKFRTLVPQDYYELAALFKFVLDEIKVGGSLRCDMADFDMLSNIQATLFHVFSAGKETALQTGMKNMREFLNKRTGAAFDVAHDPETIKRNRGRRMIELLKIQALVRLRSLNLKLRALCWVVRRVRAWRAKQRRTGRSAQAATGELREALGLSQLPAGEHQV